MNVRRGLYPWLVVLLMVAGCGSTPGPGDGGGPGNGDGPSLWTYSLVTDTATPVTSFEGELVGAVSVSPDGREIVFARADEAAVMGSELADPDLWIVGLDGDDLRLLVEGGDHPAWSDD